MTSTVTNLLQIAVPYHYPLERRSEGVEQLLKSMWIDAERRKNEPEPAMVGTNIKVIPCSVVGTY